MEYFLCLLDIVYFAHILSTVILYMEYFLCLLEMINTVVDNVHFT